MAFVLKTKQLKLFKKLNFHFTLYRQHKKKLHLDFLLSNIITKFSKYASYIYSRKNFSVRSAGSFKDGITEIAFGMFFVNFEMAFFREEISNISV